MIVSCLQSGVGTRGLRGIEGGGRKGHGDGGFQQNQGIWQVGKRRYTTNSLQALTSDNGDQQTPTMLAGPVGVAQVVCTKLSPLDSTWVMGLKECQSCRTNVVSFGRPTTMPYTST